MLNTLYGEKTQYATPYQASTSHVHNDGEPGPLFGLIRRLTHSLAIVTHLFTCLIYQLTQYCLIKSSARKPVYRSYWFRQILISQYRL